MKSSVLYNAFAILLTVFGGLSACSKTATTTNNPPPVPPVDTTILSGAPGVYATGTISTCCNNYAAYWKNNKLVQLSDSESYANCITVVDSDVYVAGYSTGRMACYWKNGVFNSLFHGYSVEYTTDICSNGQDVYIAGYGRNGMNHQVAEYWKNGQLVSMPPDFVDAAAYGIAVSGSDVYLVGSASNPAGRGRAILWKNGTPIALTDGSHFAMATGIFIQGSDIYICGEETDYTDSFYVAKYWKNGHPVILSDSTSVCFTNSIFVDQNDVYVAGLQVPGTNLLATGKDIATYWKNGIETKLFPASDENDSYVNTILVWNSDLYLSYHNAPASNIDTYPGYLKNQTVQLVDYGSFDHGFVNDIFIKH